MAPRINQYPGLPPPFVNHAVMVQEKWANCLVRVPCALLNVHDATTAIAITTDIFGLAVILTTAYEQRGDGTLAPVEFPDDHDFFILEGIVKDNGWALMLTKNPRPIKQCDMSVLNEIIHFAHDVEWLDSAGVVPPDPRLELEYNSQEKPALLQLLARSSVEAGVTGINKRIRIDDSN